MITGGESNDTFRPLLVGELAHHVVCTAELERARELQVLRLDPHTAAGELVQHGRAQQRRHDRDRRDSFRCFLDVLEFHHVTYPLPGDQSLPRR